MKESEKDLEKKLTEVVEKQLGGWSIKLLTKFINGLPDRMLLLPDERIVFVEVKGTGKKPEPLQKVRIRKLKSLGFDVRVINSTAGIEQIKKDYDRAQ